MSVSKFLCVSMYFCNRSKIDSSADSFDMVLSSQPLLAEDLAGTPSTEEVPSDAPESTPAPDTMPTDAAPIHTVDLEEPSALSSDQLDKYDFCKLFCVF